MRKKNKVLNIKNHLQNFTQASKPLNNIYNQDGFDDFLDFVHSIDFLIIENMRIWQQAR